ncbi:kynureninase [Woeseiaceae bacterium]|nr:kynureninase [Woeseiaceae bacterium]
MIKKQDLINLDNEDVLSPFRDEFHLPENTYYFDGNSLGMAPKITHEKMRKVIVNEWGQGVIRSWIDHEWGISPQRIGNKIARLIGAEDGEVIAADSTSINIFKMIAAALQSNPDRQVVLTEKDNFPTDLYMMQGLENFTPNQISSKIVSSSDLIGSLDESVAALLLSEVNYKTGSIAQMKEITQKAHHKGIMVIWDLSHSVGSIPVNLNDCLVDFAVGCGYKFLNGGPGAPAFLFAAKRHHHKIEPILSGWFGHADPFAFSEQYTPAKDVTRLMCGTPPLLGLIALECGVDILLRADINLLREKAKKLGSIFIDLIEEKCKNLDFLLASPRDNSKRGGHVSLSHPHGFALSRALVERGVVCDFRTPDIVRFGITPLYMRYQDLYDAVEIIADVAKSTNWEEQDATVALYT